MLLSCNILADTMHPLRTCQANDILQAQALAVTNHLTAALCSSGAWTRHSDTQSSQLHNASKEADVR